MTSIGITILLMVGAAAWLLLLRARSLQAQRKRQASKENRMTLREYIIEHTPVHVVGYVGTVAQGRVLCIRGTYNDGSMLFRVVQVLVPLRYSRDETVAKINEAIAAQIEGKFV